jgi:hypothetical protein
MHVTLIGTGNMARGIGSRVAGGHHRLTGAYALGPEAGEWLQQATLAIRARVSLDVLRDTIQPFPTFSEIYLAALKTLHEEMAQAGQPVGPARRKELAR